jgi:polyhydroxyalkanoate synthesis regulator phasin
MILDLGEFEEKPSNKIEGFYERIKEHLPSLQSHRCSEGKPGGFFKRIKEGTWMGHIIEHVALELQTLAGMDTGWGRTRGVKGQKGVYNVVFNYVDKDKGKLAAREAFNVVTDIINDRDPQIDNIVKKLKPKRKISRIQSMMGVINESSETTDYVVGKEFWFEYHCFESPKSCDAELWYRTHNKVLVLSIEEHGCGDTKLERLLEGCPRVYRVVFEDGFEYDVFEDELMESKEEFERPDAPKNLQESIRRILKEETQGIESFLTQITETYPETERFIDSIESFIKNSNCKKIEVAAFKYPALGLAVHNGVLFNEIIFKQELPNFLFIIFHEIAHQYQYKKYGDEKMYEFYLDEIDVKDAAIAMKKIEIIADEFANRKVREFVKLGYIDTPNRKTLSVYKDVPLNHFERLISQSKNTIRLKNVSSFDEIAEIFYNMIKVNDI